LDLWIMPKRHISARAQTATAPYQRPAASRGTLWLAATPIGNLEDVTLRTLRMLREARWVACEDTRRTARLLGHHGITARTISYHEHNERQRTPELLAALERGESVVLVTDAGTPLISDPGYRLVRAAIEHQIPVVPLPGPSAVLAALSASGLPCDEFLFGGFLPPRRAERLRALDRLRSEPRTVVLFEAPHRLAASLADAAQILGPRNAAVGRELTKMYEHFSRGTLADLAAEFAAAPVRGEITLVIGPAPESAAAGTPPSTTEKLSASAGVFLPLAARVNELMRAEGLSRNAALKRAAHERGITRREAYQQLVSQRNKTAE
jgi:16S rRNA (cytidine1402-2'-O)-methyltransferase